MAYIVVKEIWSLPIGSKPAELKSVVGAVGGGDTKDAAEERAAVLASVFNHSGHTDDEDGTYWWGRNEGASESYRFVIKSA